MKRVTLVITLAAALATMALSQCPMQEGKGPMAERNEMCLRMDRDGGRGMGMEMMGRGQGQWWENPMVVKELGLNEKQSEQIDQLSLNHRKAVIKLEADLKIAQIEFQDMIEGNASEADIRKKAKALSQLREKMQDLRIDHMLAVRKVLTPEQQKKLKELRPGMRQHRMIMEKGGCGDGPCNPTPPAPPKSPN